MLRACLPAFLTTASEYLESQLVTSLASHRQFGQARLFKIVFARQFTAFLSS
jgi:hypothetical protein